MTMRKILAAALLAMSMTITGCAQNRQLADTSRYQRDTVQQTEVNMNVWTDDVYYPYRYWAPGPRFGHRHFARPDVIVIDRDRDRRGKGEVRGRIEQGQGQHRQSAVTDRPAQQTYRPPMQMRGQMNGVHRMSPPMQMNRPQMQQSRPTQSAPPAGRIGGGAVRRAPDEQMYDMPMEDFINYINYKE